MEQVAVAMGMHQVSVAVNIIVVAGVGLILIATMVYRENMGHLQDSQVQYRGYLQVIIRR
uniref:Uncharacterized protein n=1 Tax=viral metagenome TaxID=1070528 RepID=A0A6C0E5J3_9ZZZZ